jgi:hypothetical protein
MLILILLINYYAIASDWRLVEGFDNTATVTRSNVQSIQCFESNNCYAIVQHATKEDYGCRIYISSDSGTVWILINTTKHESAWITNVNDGVAPYPGYYFLLSDDDTFLEKSTDGGRTFRTIELEPKSYYPRNIAMYDTNYGFIDNSYSYFTTTNSWETFERHPKLHTNQTYYSPVFLDSNTVGMIYLSPWANSFGKGESFVKYHLDKNTWDTLYYFERDGNVWIDFIFGIYFVNDNLGYACGRQTNDSLSDGQYIDIIYKTTNGGNNWKLIHKQYQYPYKGFYNNIAFADENNGIAVGFYGKIAMTNDGGETWVYEPVPNAMDNCRKMLVCWAGRTPLIGTWDAGIFRYEGDFFKFPEDTTRVEEKPQVKGIILYPNPVSDFLYLKNAEQTDNIKILSALGIIVLEGDYKDKIDLSSLNSGLYFLKAGNQIIKFIKY